MICVAFFSKFCQTSLDYFSYLTILDTNENTLGNKEVTAENIPVLSGRLVLFRKFKKSGNFYIFFKNTRSFKLITYQFMGHLKNC